MNAPKYSSLPQNITSSSSQTNVAENTPNRTRKNRFPGRNRKSDCSIETFTSFPRVCCLNVRFRPRLCENSSVFPTDGTAFHFHSVQRSDNDLRAHIGDSLDSKWTLHQMGLHVTVRTKASEWYTGPEAWRSGRRFIGLDES